MEFSLNSLGQSSGDDTDLLYLEQRLSESLHQLHLKRNTLEESRKELNTAYLARHELERSLDRARRENQELQLQLELANGALRRWEEERGGLRETASRQRVQLDAALAERDLLKDQARDLQMDSMKLRRKVEELDGQTRYQVAYQDSNMSGQNKLRTIHEQIISEVHKLEDDQKRLLETMEVAKARASNALMAAEHHVCLKNQADNERSALEKQVTHLGAKIDVLLVANSTPESSDVSNEKELSTLKERVQELETRLTSEIECSTSLVTQQQVAVKQQEIFKKLEQEASEKLVVEEQRALTLEESNNALTGECSQLKENLRLVEKALLTERELAKKAECVERGVQCNASEMENNLLMQSVGGDNETNIDGSVGK